MTDSPALNRLSPARARVTVVFDAEQVKKAEDTALGHLSEHVNIEGFRPGKAPADLVRPRINPSALLEETVRELLRTKLPELIMEHKLQPIIAPRVETTSKDPLTVQITFIERPTATVKKLDKISIEKKDTKPSEKDVEKIINSLLQEARTFKEIEEPAGKGHQLTIAFTGTDEAGAKIPGMETENYPVVIGESNLLPGFEDHLVGLKKGDEKNFKLTLPNSHSVETLRGKKVDFHVKAAKVEQVVLPELTDALAKEKFQIDTAKELRERVTQSIGAQEAEAERLRRERLLLDEISDRTEVDIPPELVEEEVRAFVMETEERLRENGQTFGDWMKREGKTPEVLEAEWKKQAERRLKLRFGIASIIEEKQIRVTDDEVGQMAKDLLQTVPPAERPKMESRYAKGTEGFEELRWRASVEKALSPFLA